MWGTVKLGDVVSFEKVNGKDSGLRYVGMENISSESMQLVGDVEVPESTSSTFIFDDSHVLYGRLRPYLKKVLLPDFKGQCSTEIFCLKPNDALLRGYLAYWLLNPIVASAIENTSTGARMPRANMKAILDFELALPPLAEQQRIVAKLDAAFAEIDKTIDIEQEKLCLISRMQARLNSLVFNGKARDTSQWRLTSLGEVCTATQGVQIPKSKQIQTYQNGYLRYLYISDFRHTKSLKYVEDKYPKKLVSSDDLVMSNTGSQGQVFRGVEGVLSNNLFKIGVNKELISVDYLFEFLKSDVFIDYQNERTRGTTQPHMGHKNFLSTPILLPPISIQNEVVMKLSESNEVFERILEIGSNKKELLNTLKSAILAQELQPPQSEAA